MSSTAGSAWKGAYFDLGKMGYTANTLPAGTWRASSSFNGVNLDCRPQRALDREFSLFGRAGVIYADAKDTFTGTGAVVVVNPSPSERATNCKYGGGLQYDFTEILRHAWPSGSATGSTTINTRADPRPASSVFAHPLRPDPACCRQVHAAAPEPVVYTPPPYVAPIPVIVPVVFKTQKLLTILDLTFEINRDTIGARRLGAACGDRTFPSRVFPDATAVIEGHTDNVRYGRAQPEAVRDGRRV